MARVKRGVAAKKRHKKVLEQAKGYYGNKSRSFRAANEQVMHSGQYAFRDRRAKKGEFRRLWIQRINAACRAERHQLQPVHRRPQCGRHRGRPQDPRRAGGVPIRRHSAALVEAAKARWRKRAGNVSHQPELGFTNPQVQRLRRLIGRRSSRSEEGAFVVEGRLLIAEAIAAGWSDRVGVRRGRRSARSLTQARRTCSPREWRERVADLETLDRPVRRGPRAPARPRGARHGHVRRRRRPGVGSGQPRHDHAFGRSVGRRRRRGHAGHGRPDEPEGVARRRPERCSTSLW